MNVLFGVLIIGAATSFVVEFINNTLGRVVWWVSPRAVRLWLTLPIAFGAGFLLGFDWLTLIVVALAASWLSNALLLLIERASIVNIKR